MKTLLAFILSAAISLGPAHAARFMMGAGTPTIDPPVTTNAFYALPQAAYTCSTNYYVSTTGSNSNSSTQAQNPATPWLTIGHAESTLSGTAAGSCINVAPGTYNENVTLSMHGNSNAATGYGVLRCSTTAQPWLYKITVGAQGSMPTCNIVGQSNPYSVISVPTTSNYVIVDGFDVSQTFSTAAVTGFSYNSGTGVVSLTVGSGIKVCPGVGINVSGLTGSGSIGSANVYAFASSGTTCSGSTATATTITYTIAAGLTLSYSSGGTISYISGSSFGIESPTGNPNPASHHEVVINNVFHDLGGAGITCLYCDNLFWVGNVVYNTAWTNGFDGSGISTNSEVNASYTAGTWDGSYGSTPAAGKEIRNVIANNFVYGNGNLVSPYTDGNGIIIDTNHGAQTSCTVSSYSYGTLVYGNVVWANGGKGIHVFYSSNTVVDNNTTYINELSTLNTGIFRTGIDSQCGSNNTFQNNTTYEQTGSGNLVANIGDGSVYNDNLGTGNFWQNNMAYVGGTLYACSNFSSSGTGVVCYQGLDKILKTAPSAWASGTTYAANAAVSEGGFAFSSLAGSNVGHDPLADAPTPGVVGTYWQNVGLPNNNYPADPLYASPTTGDFQLQSGSPALGNSNASVTSLGGPVTSTPNIGAY